MEMMVAGVVRSSKVSYHALVRAASTSARVRVGNTTGGVVDVGTGIVVEERRMG